MKREFREENFEEFIKRSADNLRMRAPEKVWENLSNKLNKERRRFNAGLSAFLLLTGLLGYLSISTTRQIPLATSQRTAKEESTVSVRKVQTAKTHNTNTTDIARAHTTLTGISNQVEKTVSALPTAYSSLQGITADEPTSFGSEAAPETSFVPTIVDDNPNFLTGATAANQFKIKPAFLTKYDATPLSIESVINSFKGKKNRFSTEYHFTPTISYRKLSENKSYLRKTSALNSPPNYAALYGSVNNMVTHKPDVGFELGVTEKYSLTQKVRLRAGLQFNVNRYDIKAFNAPFALATIALNNRGRSGVDSVYAISNYSNVDGSSNKTDWLKNLSFQVSAPVGVELVLKGNDKMQFGIATTVQPTYVLGDRAYLITTDYKNYTQVPWLLRRWNVNTALETFVSYQSGKARWQVGPQVRYQLLSSFISDYPVKEYLFDFGLKVGVSLNK